MIVAALSLLAISLSMSSFLMLAKASTSASAYTRIHAELRHAMDVIERDIRSGISVAWAYGGSTDRLIICTKTTTGDEYVYFYTSGTKLYRRQNGSIKEVASGLSNVSFTLIDANGAVTTSAASANAVEITLNGSSRVLSEVCEDTLRTRIDMRNKDV